ncbi:LysR family transcriptional regulator [Ectothiorhodospiraceae bacterium WFHF3C12]|nr:LysR family transcriptional regulator [Ectothiorhodospiraceae bacterium WFHF3C12]
MNGFHDNASHPAIEVRHLRLVMALRATGTLAGAARRLHTTPSALSHTLAVLEERCGDRVIVRRTRPLRFTGTGRRLLALADEAMPLLERAERDVRRMACGEDRRLHIAMECHSCYEWLMPVLERFRGAQPGVDLDLTAGFSFQAMAALRRAEVDLVITPDRGADDAFTYAPLFRHEVVLAVGAHHRLARAAFIRPEDLAGETLITYPVERARLDVFRSFLDPAGVEPARVRTAQLTVMILQLVASGRGVAMLPGWALAANPTPGHVVAKRVGARGWYGGLHAASRAEAGDDHCIRAFIDIAREVARERLTGIAPPSGA